jgi:hypothetical protein
MRVRILVLLMGILAFSCGRDELENKREFNSTTVRTVDTVDPCTSNNCGEKETIIIAGKDGRDGRDGRDGLEGRDGRDGRDSIIVQQRQCNECQNTCYPNDRVIINNRNTNTNTNINTNGNGNTVYSIPQADPRDPCGCKVVCGKLVPEGVS